jgi:predicted DNA-binding transcriptional regulator AlpA
MTKLLDHKKLKELKGISHGVPQLMRMAEAGLFPGPVKVGRRCFWVEEEVDLHLENLIADRDGLPRPPVPMPEFVRRFVPMLPSDGARAEVDQERGGNQRLEAGGFGNSKLEGSEK